MKSAPVVSATAITLALLLLSAYTTEGWNEEGLRVVVRWTAKVAVVLFVALVPRMGHSV
jgi:hypothetical protein